MTRADALLCAATLLIGGAGLWVWGQEIRFVVAVWRVILEGV